MEAEISKSMIDQLAQYGILALGWFLYLWDRVRASKKDEKLAETLIGIRLVLEGIKERIS